MARDIEEFLRRAAERRKQQQARPAQPSRPAQPDRQPPRTIRQSQPRQRTRNSPPPLIIDDVQVIRNESVAEHVNSYINTEDISDQASHLGERIIGEAKRIDEQVHSHLDHDMTALDDNPSVFDQPGAVVHRREPPPMAKELIQMLSSPASFRQAILINEILKRPSFDDDENEGDLLGL